MNIYFILQLLLNLLFVQLSWQTCSLNPPEPIVENPKPKPGHTQALSGHIIVPYYNFTCYGVVTSWEARITQGRMGQESDIRFQVWQVMTQSDEKILTYHLVGENDFTIQPTRIPLLLDKISLTVPPLKQIEVSPGDIVGIFIGGGDVKIRTEASSSVLTFVANADSPLENFEEPFLNPPFTSRLMVAPQLTIQVNEAIATAVTEDKGTVSSPATPPMKTSGTDGVRTSQEPPSYALIVGVPVSVAALIGVCAGIIIFVVIFFIWRKKVRNNGRLTETDSPQRQTSNMSTLLHSFNTSRRNLFAAFKKQENAKDTVQDEPASSARRIIEVDLRGKNPAHSQSTLELSYAYPTIDSTAMTRSSSASLPRKTGSHTHLPLPEIPQPIELTKNPSYSTLEQPDGAEDELYDVPVFRQQKPSFPVEYEIPVSSLTLSGGLTLECSHVYESTDDIMYSEID